MGFVQETSSAYIVRIDFDKNMDNTVASIFNTDTFTNVSGGNLRSVTHMGNAASTTIDPLVTTVGTNGTTTTDDDSDFMLEFLRAVSMNEGESSTNSRSYAIAKVDADGTAFDDTAFIAEIDDLVNNPSNGLTQASLGATITDDPNVNFLRNLLEGVQSASGGTVFDLNAMSSLVIAPADEYGAALESLRAISGTASLGISELTAKTTDVQVAQGKLEMVNGVIKNAINYLNQRARALTQ